MDNLDYGVIGNCTSAALISKTGSMDWCCLPTFDSSSIFAKLLDKDIGGHFAIKPVGHYRIKQTYIDKTNVLITSFVQGDDAFELIDFMPRYRLDTGVYHCPPDVIRLIRVISGAPRIQVDCQPKLVYAKHPTRCVVNDHYIKYFTTKGSYESVYLYTDMPLQAVADGTPLTLTEDAFCLLTYNQKLIQPTLPWAHLEMERTKVYWMGWVAKTAMVSVYQAPVVRSALVLKLLAYQKTGAILAAITTSLPESIGSVRNWDYRFCWMRDASMTIKVLTQLGHYNVAKRFLGFLLDVIPYKDEKIQIMYGIKGQKKLVEMELDWLQGYEGSRPVRVGNAAYKQRQNDMYGIALDVIYQSLRLFGQNLDNKEDLWTVVRSLARHVRNNWHNLDSGIWEFRTSKKHFVFSKILCWVALDRAVRIAEFFEKMQYAHQFITLRNRIKADILAKGCDPKTGALTQFYGGTSLDSANLLAEQYGFLDASDPVYVKTVRQSYEKLCVDGLMYRYRDEDDFGKPESSFMVCTFWMIRALYRIGEKQLAKDLFDKTLSYGNHLGLFSEDICFTTKRLLGNFPQGYSHLALIDTAMTLSDVTSWSPHSDDIKTSPSF